MRLFTCRWANRELGDLACQPVGISRGVPRFSTGYRYRQMRELAPNDETWAERDMEAFRLSYLRQLREIGAGRILERLGRVSGGLPVVLLCFEDVRAGQECHRRMLSAFLERETGISVPELEPSDLPQREDAPEKRLF